MSLDKINTGNQPKKDDKSQPIRFSEEDIKKLLAKREKQIQEKKIIKK